MYVLFVLIEISNQRARNNSVSLWKCGYLRKLTNPARRGVGNKILLLFTFVTVKQPKKFLLSTWSCAIRLPWNIGSKVEFQNPWERMATNSKGGMNYSYLIFSLPAISSNFIFFFSTDQCTSRDLIEQITESSELDFLAWRSTLYKNKLTQGSHTIEVCYHNDQAEKRKITNAYNFFSFWACVLAVWCSLFKWCGFNLAVYCELQWRYSLASPQFIKLSRRRTVHTLHIWHTRSPYQSRSLSI